jgi:hypothetical protein
LLKPQPTTSFQFAHHTPAIFSLQSPDQLLFGCSISFLYIFISLPIDMFFAAGSLDIEHQITTCFVFITSRGGKPSAKICRTSAEKRHDGKWPGVADGWKREARQARTSTTSLRIGSHF